MTRFFWSFLSGRFAQISPDLRKDLVVRRESWEKLERTLARRIRNRLGRARRQD